MVRFLNNRLLNVYDDYQAIVIGISDYEYWPKIPNAVKDAKAVAQNLKELGFEVKLLLDLSSRELKTALSEIVYNIGNKENRAILFYFALHGETEVLADKTSMGYIIPKDCPILQKDPVGFSTHAISMKEIESISLRIKSKHVMMLFDSCFSGSLFNLVRAVPRGISEKSALPVRQFITAGSEDETVPDKSMFKRVFLIGLKGDADLTNDGYITGSELGMYISEKVVSYTRSAQHPQYGKINNPDLDRGDFLFIPPKIKMKVQVDDDLQKKKAKFTKEIETIRKEREKTEKLLEEMKQLLEAQRHSEGKKAEIIAEKRELEKRINQVKLAEKEKRKLEEKLTAAEDRLLKETEKGRGWVGEKGKHGRLIGLALNINAIDRAG